jgi:predicted ATP-dependent protease
MLRLGAAVERIASAAQLRRRVMIQTLSWQAARWVVDPSSLGFESTESLAPPEGIIGQARAVSALQLGLGIKHGGFHIYVAGPPGIGKMTAVRAFLERLAKRQLRPPDWCYVNNFEDPAQPKAIRLPAGRGRQFERDMQELVAHIAQRIPKLFESEDYTARREELTKHLERQRGELFDGLAQRARRLEFELHDTPVGLLTIPLRNGRRMDEDEVEALSHEVQAELERKRKLVRTDAQEVLKQVRRLEREARDKLQTLDRQLALFVVGGLIDDLADQYHELPEIAAHLKAVQQDILENLEAFKPGAAEEARTAPDLRRLAPWLAEQPLKKYQVNVVVHSGDLDGAPVEVELNPSYTNLFGCVEKESHLGTLYTDFTMIRPGSLHRANGGYLVLQVEDVLRSLFTWDGLKLALRSGRIEIEDLAERLGWISSKSLRPQPIPLEVKVILIGPPLLYYLLHAYDEQFAELFKIRADFDTETPNTEPARREFAAFIAGCCQAAKSRHLDAPAAAKLLEHAARLSEDQHKLSLRFGELADVQHEANDWPEQDDAPLVGAAHVAKALEQQAYRAKLIQERIQEWIDRGVLLVDTAGAAVGQINGLSVIELGAYRFGRPGRVSASVWPGGEGVVDIEREAKLSGPIHSKGVMILSGYLAGRFAKQQPLGLSARIVFEQTYEEVEGDSASSAELYALLSALADVPLRQGIAVTGSVNQHGELQAVGGINEKIEGFFDVCRAKGLTGEQGVIIPTGNVQHLMLREDVVEAIKAQRFRLWAAQTVDDGLAILTDRPSGPAQADGRPPADRVNARVAVRLRAFAESLRRFHGEGPGRRGQRPSGALSPAPTALD